MSKKSNTSKRYTPEFKRDAVALVYSSGRTVTEVARDIGVSPEGLRNWVNQDKTDSRAGAGGRADHGRARGAGATAPQGPRDGTDDRGAGKSDRLLREPQDEVDVAARYTFVDAEKAGPDRPDGYSTSLLCRALKISRSGYYAYLAARPNAAATAREEEELVAEIRQIHEESRRAYGAPRITAALRRRGRRINRKRVERLMREHDIRGITRRKRRNLTKPDRRAAPSPDLVGRDFTATEPGTKLVSDITYLPTLAG
ncbi:IS3 family transposase [Streptomyces sp. NPDC099050]|uniref:IS3 family transposase n=1 Tax=Streptomyces sp. NPDC099050 TaxID=3366100 RepID=UPI0037F9F7E2